MRVLVTGNAGFMGSHLADHLLAQGYEVYGMDNMTGGSIFNVSDGIEHLAADICDTKKMHYWFRMIKPEVVYHLAAYAAEGLSPFIRNYNYTNNVVGSANVINACINYGVKHLVFTSSMAVYGDSIPPFHEAEVPEPIDPYGVAKMAVERDIEIAYRQHGLKYTIFRPHNVYGPRQNIRDPYRNVIGIWMNQILKGEPMTIYGSGSQEREFTYIDDVTPYLARHDKIGTYNLGLGEIWTINELSLEVRRVCSDTSYPVEFLPARHEADKSYPSTEKFRLEFKPRHPSFLVEGLCKMWEWAKNCHQHGTHLPKVEVEKGLYPYWRKLL